MFRLLLVTSALFIGSIARAADFKPEEIIGKKAPAIALTDLDGKAAGFDSLRGKVATVVVFASFECPVSKAYSELLNDMAKSNADKGVKVVLICPTKEAPAAVAAAAAPFKMTMPILIDSKKEFARGITALVTPEVFVLDAEGAVRYRGRIDNAYSARLKRNPIITSHDLTDALAAVLLGKAVANPVTSPIGCVINYDTAAAPKSGAVTFYKDVQPILNNHCVVCHRQGEVGPFALTTYEQTRDWASDIKDMTEKKHMPPWMPAGGLPIRGERKMTAAEIATIGKWVDAGMPEGNVADKTKAPDFGNDGWRHGKPDLIMTPGDDFKLGATGDDLFRVFVVPTGLTEDKWVIGYDVKPGNPRVVHHTLHYFDTLGKGRALEKQQPDKDKAEEAKGRLFADRGPGYTASMGVGFASSGGKRGAPTFGGIGGWAPGQSPQFVPDGMGWLLPKGSDFLIQTHYHRNGQPARDRTQIGLYFAKKPVEQPWQTIVVNGLKPTEKILAGKADHKARGGFYLHTDAMLHNVLPHMHLLGKSSRMIMTPPNGEPIVLLEILAWDYKWQETYWFKEPILAKAGTKLEIEAVFDNSANNPSNPSSPPVDVTFGERTTDEMLFGFFGATSLKTPWQSIRTSAFPPPGVKMDPPARGKLTPELERRLGTWDSTAAVKVLGSEETTRTGRQTVEKAFDGTFLLFRTLTGASSEEGGENYELATFDLDKNVYRLWTYTGQGAVFEWEGTWDEETKSFNFSATLQGTMKGTLKWNLTKSDEIEVELRAKVGFATAFSSIGKLTRKK